MYCCYKTENYRTFYWQNNIFILKKGGLDKNNYVGRKKILTVPSIIFWDLNMKD